MATNTYILEYDAFIRSIKQNKNVSHAVLLGAGASISSQIQSAADCIWEWKRDIYSSNNPNTTLIVSNFRSESVRRSIQAWLDGQGEYPMMGASDEYSFYAEKAYPIEADRQKYFEQLAYNKAPYIGYLLAKLNYKRFMFKKLCILLIFSKLKVIKLLIDKYRMHNLYAIFAKLLNICKQIAGNLVNESGNVPRRGVVPKFSDLEVVALNMASEAVGIDSESLLFAKLQDYRVEIPNLISRRQYN